MSDPVQKAERPKLSNDLSEYLLTLSVALQRHAMYPTGHPSLEPAIDAVMRRARRLLEDRPSLAFGVARRQLIVEGVTTDPEHPVLRRLAEELHRHHLGAVSVTRGVEAAELSEALRVLAAEPEREAPPGAAGGQRLEWPHVKLHPLTFDGLALVGDAPLAGGQSKKSTLSAELWVGLARAAISADSEMATAVVPLEPSAVARSIDTHPGAQAYDQVIVGYMTQIARELRTSSDAETEALRRRTSRMVQELSPETLRRIVEMGGDVGQRAAFVLDAAQGMTAEAALDVVKAAADASGQTISHSMVRLLAKLAMHTDQAPGQVANEALREQIGRLMADWSLDDPNPESHRRILQQFATAARAGGRANAGRVLEDYKSERIVQMSLETGVTGPLLDRAVDESVALGETAALLALVSSVPEGAEPIAQAIRTRLVHPSSLGALLASEPLDVESLDSLLPFMTHQGYGVLLDALASAENRATRRKLLDRLAKTPIDLNAAFVARLQDERWYVQRNMLVLLERSGRVPAGFSIGEWTTHSDPRVRSEAIRLQLTISGERDAAIRAALRDGDARVVRIGLTALAQGCPSDLVDVVAHLAESPDFGVEVQQAAAGVLGRIRDRSALDALLRMADGGRSILGRRRLPATTPVLIAVIRGLAETWSTDSRAAAVLALAARSSEAALVDASRRALP